MINLVRLVGADIVPVKTIWVLMKLCAIMSRELFLKRGINLHCKHRMEQTLLLLQLSDSGKTKFSYNHLGSCNFLLSSDIKRKKSPKLLSEQRWIVVIRTGKRDASHRCFCTGSARCRTSCMKVETENLDVLTVHFTQSRLGDYFFVLRPGGFTVGNLV